MVCYSPLTAWRQRNSKEVTFNRNRAIDPTRPVKLPCGQCVGCRLEKSRQWATRCMHEAQMWEHNTFITLTYNDENLPEGNSLLPDDLTRFWKRLRKATDQKIRYFACGEYGDKIGRPHYHAVIFNLEFADKKFFKMSYYSNGDACPLFRSEMLEKLWPYGFSSIGEVTFESAAYVARYVMKKRTGDAAEDYYRYIDRDGVVHDRVPEFVRMSRRPGVGKTWFEKYGRDVYPGDFVVVKGRKYRPPRYYDEQLEEKEREELKRRRIKSAEKHADNNTPDRRRVREVIQMKKAKRLLRPEG